MLESISCCSSCWCHLINEHLDIIW